MLRVDMLFVTPLVRLPTNLFGWFAEMVLLRSEESSEQLWWTYSCELGQPDVMEILRIKTRVLVEM